MQECIKQSIEYANQRNYLDNLFQVYPAIPDGIRSISQKTWNLIEDAFRKQDNISLIEHLLCLDLFPIKDSYVAYLRRDKGAIYRNPETINRLAGRIYEIGLKDLYEKCSEPKETNRKIGPLFKAWVKKGCLGVPILKIDEFTQFKGNAILDASDKQMKAWAKECVNYTRDKGLDFIAKFNNKYILGEAKFLTDFGGHQNSQFEDAMQTLNLPHVKAVQIAILDGVLYIPTGNKLYNSIVGLYSDKYIMSALVLREFLYAV